MGVDAGVFVGDTGSLTVSIPNGGTTTPIFDIGSAKYLHIFMPSTLTGTTLSILATNNPGGTGDAGAPAGMVSTAAGALFVINWAAGLGSKWLTFTQAEMEALKAARYLQLVSNGAEAAKRQFVVRWKS